MYHARLSRNPACQSADLKAAAVTASPAGSRSSLAGAAPAGALLVLAPCPFLLACAGVTHGQPAGWRLLGAAAAALCLLAAALLLVRKATAAKGAALLALAASALVVLPVLVRDPLSALAGGVALIQATSFLLGFRPQPLRGPLANPHEHRLRCARGGLWTLLPVALTALVLNPRHLAAGDTALLAALLLAQAQVLCWATLARTGLQRIAWVALLLVAGAGGALALQVGLAAPAAIAASLAPLALLPRPGSAGDFREHWWEPLLNHPARVLITTFLGLCLLGTLLLQLPWAANGRPIALVDAAFTAVSAVCVTGLTVLDTPRDFTLPGQACILLLIQCGGFGIMTISTVGLHALGKRLTLRQERLLTTLTETSHQDLFASLALIVRFTLLVELAGAVLLAGGFLAAGASLPRALWQGLFTAVSAFCNAGFALHSANLVPFQTNPLILHTVALLILLGGLAPATCLLLPDWLRGRAIPLAPRLALVTSAALLLAGALAFLVFEWDNALAGLALVDRLHNAWFQSVTLRTAGFNSVDLATVLGPTCMFMHLWMFIGGSPGGTAGGVKTTTIAVLALTFWANITGRGEVIVANRRLPQATINRAVTVVGAGLLVWAAAALGLQITQPLPARSLLFEVTSALGTVGLSLGITPSLDGIGKVIIMLTMFIGRVGPLTLFTLLGGDSAPAGRRCPDARITLG